MYPPGQVDDPGKGMRNMNTEDKESSAKGTILVVDDNPSNLNLLSTVLRENGYEVRPAISGALAIQSLRLSLPDLILLDIRMPEMDGYELCGQLKADKRTRDIPVIFISAMGEVMDKVRAFGVGGVDYIMKPFHFEEVLARVGTHITLRAAQKSLIQSERLAALGRLSQTVAHEVRNPVTVIGGFARRLQKQMPQEDPTQKILSVILEETERLERIVTDVERYCRLRQPVPQPADVTEIIDRILLSLSERLQQQGISVQRIGFDETREVLGDEELLELALNNVLLNAAEALPKGGILQLTIIPQPDGVLLSVKDTGTGIPAKIIQNVFEPFLTSKARWSGLGLALARRIIDEQRGEIDFCSSLGSGTEVRIKMPYNRVPG